MRDNKVGRLQLYVVVTILIVTLSTLLTRNAVAAINQSFTYQGKIVNTNGTNVTSSEAACIVGGADTCDFRINIYDDAAAGTLRWQETKSDVEIGDNDGIFNLVLDCGGTFDSCNQNGGPDFTSGELFVEVEFDPSGNGDFAEGETFSPRRELTAVPYAFNAETADSAGLLDSIDSSEFLRSNSSDTFDAGYTLTIDGTLDTNADISFADDAIVFDGPSTEFSISGDLSINLDDLFVQKSTGFVGIGNSSPSSPLHIDQDLTYAGIGQQLLVNGSVTGAASTNVYGANISPESITIPTGTTSLSASLYVNEPIITATGTLTNAATIYIAGAATEAANNFAFWVDAGTVQLDEVLNVLGDVHIGGTSAATSDIYLGSNGAVVINEQGNNADFRIDGSGASLSGMFFADASTAFVGIGTTAPTAYLDLAAATTSGASARIRTGTTPSAPNEGDIYADGTDVYYRNSAASWENLSQGNTLQESYVGGNSISIASGVGALNFDAVSANFDIEIGQGTDTGDFRIWDGTNNWFLVDEDAASISLGNASVSGLTLTSGSNWSFSSAGALSGVSTLSSSGDWTWSATTPTITVNSAETFTVTDGTDSYTINTSGSSFGMSDGTNSVTFDLDTGPAFAGSARPTKTITLSPEYPGAVLTPFYGAGTDTNITGTMISDSGTTPASDIRTYYAWERGAATQHFYTVAVRITLPADFSAWTTTNAIQISYITESATSTDSDVDARIYLEGNGTLDASSTDNASTSWATITIDDSALDLWNAAGETGVIYLRLGSQSGNFARIGDITLNYLASF